MFKKIRNKQRKGNKVSVRYRYVSQKADWIYENTLERFDFAIKKRFGDRQDTTHFVYSFSRILTEEEKLKAREIIANFFLKRFGDEHFMSVAEHNDTDQTHYHVLLSRNIETSRMLHLNSKEYIQLTKDINKALETLMNEYEIEIKKRYGTGEYARQFGHFEYSNYKQIKEKLDEIEDIKEKSNAILSLLPFATDKMDSYKAITRIISELVSELLNKNELTTLSNFMEQAGIKIFLEKTGKGRERIKIEFVKDWKFLENAKTTKFRVSNLNKEVSNYLKQVLKEFKDGITRIDTDISREIKELERQIQSDRRRYTEIRARETAVRAGDRNQTDKVRAIRRRIAELSARIRELKARDISDRTGKTGKTIGVREVKQGIKTTGKVIKSIAREFNEIAKVYINFRRREREIIARSLRDRKDRYSTKEYERFKELERRFEEYTGYISETKSYISGVFDKFRKVELKFERIAKLENRLSDIQRRFDELTRGDTNRDKKDRNEKSDITRAISELERELSELTTELERARETAERVKQKATRRNREDTKNASQDNNRNRRTQELSNINNDDSINTEFDIDTLHISNVNQKDTLGEEEMISLEFAKRNIDIGEFAEKVFGYEYKKEKGNGRWRTYKKGEDIILVSKSETGHFVYKNIDNQADKGTIIDFIQNRMGGKDKFNLWQVRKLLTDYWNNSEKIESIEVENVDIEKGQELQEELKELNIYDNYLVNERKISPDLLKNQYIYEDNTKHKNVVFELFGDLERDKGKRIGLAKYNRNFKQIKGQKGIWTTKIDDIEKAKNISNIVITESPVDALSYLELENMKAKAGEAGALRKEDTFLISTQGQIGKNTIDYVYSYVKAINQLSDKKVFITLSFDNDAKGQEMSIIMKNQLNKRLKEDNIDMMIIIEKPKLKDWNEDLVLVKEKEKKEKEENISIQIDLSPNKSPNRKR